MFSRPSAIGLRVLGSLCVLAGLCLLEPSRTGHAGKWPRPAGGSSASGDPELLLTFDDGPHETHTARILDALEARGLKAIFFWTGRRITSKNDGMEERRALVERAVLGGHLVGNHTATHAKLCAVSKDEAAREIDDNAKLFAKLTGLPLFLMRVPYGARCKRLDKMLASRQIQHIHWDIDPQEFRHRDAELAFKYVVRRVRRLGPGERAVLLMHDTQPATAKALPLILDWVESENARRRKASQRPIRIIDGSQFVEERYSVTLLGWSRQSLDRARQELFRGARKLTPF